MIYVPSQWLVKESNMDAVHEILSSGLYTEINVSQRKEDTIQRLRDIGENGIAEKLKNGEIILPS